MACFWPASVCDDVPGSQEATWEGGRTELHQGSDSSRARSRGCAQWLSACSSACEHNLSWAPGPPAWGFEPSPPGSETAHQPDATTHHSQSAILLVATVAHSTCCHCCTAHTQHVRQLALDTLSSVPYIAQDTLPGPVWSVRCTASPNGGHLQQVSASIAKSSRAPCEHDWTIHRYRERGETDCA